MAACHIRLANLPDSSGYLRRCQGFVYYQKADHQSGKPAQMKLYRESEIDDQWHYSTNDY